MAVRHRNVWYFHGFDPAPPARYRRIFAAASERLGVAIEDLPGGAEGWRATRGGVTSDIRYLRYEAFVRSAQAGSFLQRFGRGVRTVVAFAMDGALFRLPLRVVALMLAPVVIGLGAVMLAANLTGAGSALALIPMAGVIALAWFLLVRMKVLLVSDLFAHLRVLGQGDDQREGQEDAAAWPSYQSRIASLSRQIKPGGDETLIVGHSLGGIAAILAAEGLLDRAPRTARIGLLTLGSVHGIVLSQTGVGRDRIAAAVARIAADPRLFWVDVSSPRDAFTVPLTDPLTLIDAPEGAQSPLVISAQLARAPRIPGDTRTLFPAMRMHMGYLLAPQTGTGFDYADLVTGASTLAEAFAERKPSPKARMRPTGS